MIRGRMKNMSKPLYFICALLVTAGVTYLIRALPLVFVRKRIKNRFIRSFLYYVPYVVLSALSFPAVFYATENMISGVLAALACGILAYKRRSLIVCMLGSVVTVIVVEAIIKLI
jgi:branched-subunit amino acid transport protein